MAFFLSHRTASAANFEAILDEFGGKIESLARRFTACESDAQDLTQEIFLEIFTGLSSFRGESQIGTWIYRVAWRKCQKWRDKTANLPANFSPEWEDEACDESDFARPEIEFGRREIREEVRAALQILPSHHRDILILHELHGLSYAQCAAVLEIPLGTVKSRLFNACQNLKKALSPYVLGEK